METKGSIAEPGDLVAHLAVVSALRFPYVFLFDGTYNELLPFWLASVLFSIRPEPLMELLTLRQCRSHQIVPVRPIPG